MFKTLWQLPQTLLAYILTKLWKANYDQTYKGIKVYKTKVPIGISLGTIIILYNASKEIEIKHEYGHTRQSLIFGWFYLIIIGIPSGGMNLLTRMKILKYENYYKRWPESWADKLGDVKR